MQNSWLRRAVAIVLGVVIAGGCIALIETVGHRQGDDTPAFIVAVGALFVGALVGGTLAVRIAGSSLYGWIIAAALGVLSLINVLSFPHPTWFVPAAGSALVVGGWLAALTLAQKAALP